MVTQHKRKHHNGGSGLDFGDDSDDNVVFKADISSSFIPNNDDSFDLGSDSQRWKTGYLSNLNSIWFTLC